MGKDAASYFDLSAEMRCAALLVGVPEDLLYTNLRSAPGVRPAKLVALWLIASVAEEKGLSHRVLCTHNPTLGNHSQFSHRLRSMVAASKVPPKGPAGRVLASFRVLVQDARKRRSAKALSADEIREVVSEVVHSDQEAAA